jgi:hypothetical protein
MMGSAAEKGDELSPLHSKALAATKDTRRYYSEHA